MGIRTSKTHTPFNESINMQKEIDFQKELKSHVCYLHFQFGQTFKVFSNLEIDSAGIWGEAAFTTGMSGYEETLTDPSFLGQHIIFTASHIGNYVTDKPILQSQKVHATSVIARHISFAPIFSDLKKLGIPLITGLDTREITRQMVRQPGLHLMYISKSETPPKEFDAKNLITDDLFRVSTEKVIVHKAGDNPIVMIDYGVKNAIVESIKEMGFPFVQVPYSTSFEEIKNYQPRLVFLSNGPGDPRNYKEQIETVKKILTETNIPIRAICLGHQLIALAHELKVTKLPFGQRGINHPVFNRIHGNVLITSQNHGYAIDEKDFELKKDKHQLFAHEYSLFDHSIEGIQSIDWRLVSAQYHPESHPGPLDGHEFFKEITRFLNGDIPKIQFAKIAPYKAIKKREFKKSAYKRILLVGSGPIKIGQASEFDYSGTQALKALKEEGIEVVLLNSNPATIMTDPEMCYRTYIEPISKDTIKKIIEKENIDAVLSTMGGQTALNICVELEEEKYFESKNVTLLGANVDTIKKTEDRALFAKELDTLGYQTGKRFTAHDLEEAITLSQMKVGFPLIIRRDFALGGKGAALVFTSEELKEVIKSDPKFPVTMEKSLVGQKEIEMEVMVDSDKNGVIICSIENVDPCGVHTGDSITVAPAMTISDYCLQKLRTMSLTIAKHMGVVAGGANVQFAINPFDEDDITVIEMNPRVSRSSALASKATGYPIAKISALLAIGYKLHEIMNDITKNTPVSFEPTLDYVAVKIPLFPFHKFPASSKNLGPQMRSVGEVLALGAHFNEAFLKALRSLEMGLEIPSLSQLKSTSILLEKENLLHRLKHPQELSLLCVLEALRKGASTEEVFHASNITPWFIRQMGLIKNLEDELSNLKDITNEKLLAAKTMGLSDKYIAFLTNKPLKEIFHIRFVANIFPVYKAVDTCAAEFIADTPYFYSTYASTNEAVNLNEKNKKPTVCILGSGPNRIGQGIEFDYSCVKSCEALQELSKNAVMINSNPETVSTDYDSSDRLYLSPLFSEDLFDIFINEKPHGIITSFSGQTGIQIREHLEKSFRKNYLQMNFLGADFATLDLTEDRKLFANFLEKINISKTTSLEVKGHKELVNAILEIGFPVIIRPSFVIGGESMFIFHDHNDLEELPESVKKQLMNSEVTFLVENYLENALEFDVDMVRDSSGHTVYTVTEHIENAGVHSGDSGMVTPPVHLKLKIQEKLKEVSNEMVKELKIIGPINFQFAVKDDAIYCIEANPRGSRTLPFLSKAYHLSLPKLATYAMCGEKIPHDPVKNTGFFAVKQSTFPFDRFLQDNIILGPKMRSTGETMGIDRNVHDAILKSYRGNYPILGKPGKILLSISDEHKPIMIPFLEKLLKHGYSFIGTPGTAKFIQEKNLPCAVVRHIYEKGESTIVDILKDPEIVLVINTPMNKGRSQSDGETIRNTAIQYALPCFTRPENIKAVLSALCETDIHNINPVALQLTSLENRF